MKAYHEHIAIGLMSVATVLFVMRAFCSRAIYGLANQLKLLNIQRGIKIFYPKKF
jgi:hypothetical protein